MINITNSNLKSCLKLESSENNSNSIQDQIRINCKLVAQKFLELNLISLEDVPIQFMPNQQLNGGQII
jgi:hypothetical protein